MTADRDALADLLVFTPMGDLVDTSMAPVWRTVDQILASDWLAERDARIAAEARKAALEECERVLRSAFAGPRFEENAMGAASESEWSWFRWLRVRVRALLDGAQ